MRCSVLVLALAMPLFTANLFAQQTDGPMQFLFPPEVHSSKSYLGVGLADIDADRAAALKLGEPRGVEITKVETGSPAETAGLKPGDVVLNYNGENILGAEQFVRLVQETPQGRKVKIQFWRDGKMQTASVITGAPRPHMMPMPPGINFEMPDWRGLSITEIPDPILIWKNSLLGIDCEPLGSQLAEYFGVKQGVLVRSVERGSAAEKAGIKAGDVVTGIGDRTVANPRDLASFARGQRHNEKAISLSLVRDHKELTVSLTPSGKEE